MRTDKISFFKDLPTWAKGVIAVFAVGGTAIIGWKIYNAIVKTGTEKAQKNLLKNNEQELENAQKSGQKASYPQSQYAAFANQIYEGMKYGVGDSYSDVRDVLMKMKNNLDVNLLVKQYGVRQLYVFGIPAGSPKDLFTAVRSELGNEWGGLSSSKMNAVNEDWAKKGISYRF